MEKPLLSTFTCADSRGTFYTWRGNLSQDARNIKKLKIDGPSKGSPLNTCRAEYTIFHTLALVGVEEKEKKRREKILPG